MPESSKRRSASTCLKVILTAVNAVVLLCECVLVGAVIYLTTTEKTALINSFGQKTFELSFVAVITVSVIVILITFLGAVGAISENAGFLKIVSSLISRQISRCRLMPSK